MTPEQLKELAEFAAEFIGPYVDISKDFLDLGKETDAYTFFEQDLTAPYFMHLAQEKLEKEGFRKFNHFYDGATHKIEIWEVVGSWTKHTENKNKFIAFWEAVMQAKGGK
jgi:hypothetical protein